jgi:alpha-tubulin suppressor-like RCC1 family protein
MPINISKIIEKTQEITNDSAGGSTELELSRVAEIANIIEDSSAYSVPTTSNLPTAANNTGRFVYVDDKCRYYYSNGTSWTDDYVTVLGEPQLQIWKSGSNNFGQLGTNNTICYSVPTQEACGGTNWCTLSGGGAHTSAIKTDGTLWGWGLNTLGRLGTNNTISYSVPTQEACGGTNWCMVSAGSAHNLAIKTDGTLWGWGCNACGALGTNNTICYSVPTQEVCGGTNWCMVDISQFGFAHASAIKTDGTIWSWGRNTRGQLGLNNTISYSSPQQEACGGTTWCMVSAGGDFTSAIKTNGTLWSWGCNTCFLNGASGQLGTNNTICYSVPTQEVCGGTNWCMVSAGGYQTSAIKTDGTLWSWGDNFCGILGLNNTISYSSPQQEACGGTTWCMVCGPIAIKTDGTLWGWGSNGGSLGTNDTISYSSPQQEFCGFTDWTQPYLRGPVDTSGF